MGGNGREAPFSVIRRTAKGRDEPSTTSTTACTVGGGRREALIQINAPQDLTT